MLVFFDACMWIYAVEDRGRTGEAVRSAVMDLPQETRLATTELIRFECMVFPIKVGDQATIKDYNELFADCVFLQIGRREYDLAAQLRAAYGLRALDAIHIASAISNGCDEFWTNDARLERANERIRIRSLK